MPRTAAARASAPAKHARGHDPGDAPVGSVATVHPVLTSRKVIAAAEEYHRKNEDKKALELRLKELKPFLEAAMGDAVIAYAGERILNRTDFAAIPPTPNVTITPGMVGQVIRGKKGRAAYTELRVT